MDPPAGDMDLETIKKVLYSLDPEGYTDFMKDVHFHCPFRTKELTDEIVNHWKNDQRSIKLSIIPPTPTMDSGDIVIDLGAIKKALYSLDPPVFIDFMKEVHLHCPFTTKEMTDEIVNQWENDISMKADDFYELIREREKEHTQEVKGKRLRDLKRIQDMKSKTGLDPLQLFPKEIWIMLLNHLLPQDKLNFREVHETFCDLTDEDLFGDILLPLILGCKVEQFWDDPSNVFPLAHYFELRLVSKSLKNAVDRWFEDDIISNLRSGNKKSRPSGVVYIDLHDDDDQEKVSMMKACLSSPPKPQRFFTRSLAVITYHSDSDHRSPSYYNHDEEDESDEDESDDEEEEMPLPNLSARASKCLGNIDTILDKFGDQLWYFSFEFNRACTADGRHWGIFENRYHTLLEWLSKMPNLKWLKLIINQHEVQTDIMVMYKKPPPPPTLTHLERLDLKLKNPNRNRCVPPVFLHFISANPHVKILNLRGLKFLLGKSDMDCVRKCQSLEVFCIDGFGSGAPGPGPSRNRSLIDYDDEDGDGVFNHENLIQSISKTNWPLKQIELILHMEKKSVYSVFRSLEVLQTLEKICLSVEDVSIGGNTSFLKLPLLSHFDFQMKNSDFLKDDTNWKFFFTLQFLLYAKRMKTLIWKCDMEDSAWQKMRHDIEDLDQFGEMLDFHGGFCKIKSSHLWRVFPWLKMVKAEVIVRAVDGEKDVEKSFSWKFSRGDLKKSEERKSDVEVAPKL